MVLKLDYWAENISGAEARMPGFPVIMCGPLVAVGTHTYLCKLYTGQDLYLPAHPGGLFPVGFSSPQLYQRENSVHLAFSIGQM